MAFVNVNKYVLDKVTLEDTNNEQEAFADVALLLCSVVYDSIKEGKNDEALYHLQGLKHSIGTLEYFLNSNKSDS